MITLKLALKEIKNSKKFILFFIINISVGLIGLTTLEWFKVSFDQVLSAKSKELLGADFSISTRSPISKSKIKKVTQESQSTDAAMVYTMFSMAMGKKVSRLVDLMAMTTNYPFYGQIKLKKRLIVVVVVIIIVKKIQKNREKSINTFQ